MVDGDVVFVDGSGVDLAGAGDFAGGFIVLFFPVGDPAGEASDGEHDGEHIGGDADGAQDDAAVEVNVGVEFAVDEVLVFEGLFFEVAGDVEEGVEDVEFGENAVGHIFEEFGAGVVIFVDAVAEAHEADAGAFLLGHFDIFFGGETAVVNLAEHFEDFDIGTAVEGAPEGADAGGDGGEEVGFAGADHADGAGGAILFVVGMEDEDEVEGVFDFGVNEMALVGHGEHHVEEVGAVAEGGVGVGVGKAADAAVGVGGDGADFGDEACGGFFKEDVIGGGGEFLVKAAEGVDHGGHDGHGRGIGGEAFEVMLHAFVEVGGGGEAGAEARELIAGGEAAEDQEPGDFDEVGCCGKFFNGDAAVAEDAGVAVNVGDGGLAGAGVAVALIERDVSGVGAEFGDIDSAFAFGARDDGVFVGFAIDNNLYSSGHEIRKTFLLVLSPTGGSVPHICEKIEWRGSVFKGDIFGEL